MTGTVSVSGVRKAFGETVAVADVSFELGATELLALVGPSGCGKSTLLRMLAGLIGVDSGTITVGGQVMDDGRRRVEPEHRRTGLVFQEHALFPHLTVGDNIAFGLRSVPKPARRDAVERWLHTVGLPGYRGRYAHELSGGERQRVALARALAPEPSVMLLDEPFASLDPNLRTQIRADVVSVLRSTNTPAIFVTHDQAEALATGDRVAVMANGTLEQLALPWEVYHRPKNRFVAEFMGEADLLPVDGAGRCELGAVGGREGTLAVIRPTNVQLGDLGAHPTAVRASVTLAEFRGGTWMYSATLPSGATVRSVCPWGLRLAVGDEVGAWLSDPDATATVSAADS